MAAHLPYVDRVDVARPKDLGGGIWKLSDLKRITVLFGKNGSGKSRLLRAWRDSDTANSHYIVPERVGDLTFQPGLLEQQIGPTGRRDTSRRNFESSYRQNVVTRIQAYFMTRGAVRGALSADGDATELESLLATLLPDFRLTLRGTGNPPYELVRSSNEEKVPDIDHLSSGEAQTLALALDILTIGAMWQLQGSDRRIMLVDEPDAHVHPDLLVRFSDFLVAVADKYELQIVMATHSTTLLAAIGQFARVDAGVIYLDRVKAEFRAEPFTKEAKELAACLGGHALMGPLFGVPLLLVEGDDDYRIWSQVPRHHKVSFSVIPTNGDEIRQYQKSLERIFAALRESAEPAGFALIDGDKPLPAATEQAPQAHVRFIRMACREAENLYLTDEVLALMSLDWPAASAKLISEAPKYGEKATLLASAGTWDRAQSDIKGVINQITQILDSKNVHWTIRVARAIGENRPTGSLLEFLGTSVVDALWGSSP